MNECLLIIKCQKTRQIRRLSFSGSKSSKKGNDLNHNSEGDLTLARQVQDVESKRFDMINGIVEFLILSLSLFFFLHLFNLLSEN